MSNPSAIELKAIFHGVKTIAVVGASADAAKAAHAIPDYLSAQGYRILPVNPRGGVMFGTHAYASLRDVDVPIDVVDVFRPPAEAETVAREAITAGARYLWFQPGTDEPEAVRVAREAGLTVITGLCMGATHGQLGLGPGPEQPQGLT